MTEQDNTPEAMEREIEQTRRRVSRDIDELGERLSPQRFKRQARQVVAIAALGAGAVWLLRPRNRHRISGPLRGALGWLIAHPTALTTGVSVLTTVIGLLVPGNRRERRRLKPAPATIEPGLEMRPAVPEGSPRRAEHLRYE